MVNVDLVLQRATEVQVKIDFDPTSGKNLEIGVNSPFRIDYSDDNKHCTAILEQRVISKNDPEQFSIYIKIEGYFNCDEITNDDIKKDVHIQCYYRLFPYAQALIAQMCVVAGLPPLMIRALKISADDVAISKDH